MAKWEIIEDNKFKKQTGGKVSGWKIIDDIPKFKKGGKTNLNSTVQEEPKNTVKVNQNGQIIEYDPSSPEYKKLYESGTLTSYDPETDAYITPTLKEFTVVGEKPKWAKEKENNQSKYSKDWYIDNYLPKFSRNMGISANNMNPNDVERYNSFINDKTVEDIFKRYPLFDSDYANDRLGTLKQFSPKEVELIKNSSYASALEPNVWDEFKQAASSAAVKLLTSQIPGPSFPNPYINKNLTYEEAQEASSPLNLLAPLSIPYNMTTGNAYTQQQGEKNYSWEKALKGQKPIHTSIAASVAGDPLNLLGLGLFKGLVSAGKIAKLEDAYQLVKGLGKEEALSKLKSLTSLDNYGREAFTPILDNVGVEAFGAGKPTAFKSEINWGNWNPDTPKYPELINEYNAIEQTTKANGTWMKYSDGTPFDGTPEQFIQMNSKHAQKFAGGKEAAEEMYKNKLYRGVSINNAFSDFSKSADLNLPENRGIFTGDRNLAEGYVFGPEANQYKKRILNPFISDNQPGIYELGLPKGKKITYNTDLSDWTDINLTENSSKVNLETRINSLKKILEKQKKAGAGSSLIQNQEERIKQLQKYYDDFDKIETDPVEFQKMKNVLGDVTTTDNVARYIPNTDLRSITLQNIIDGGLGDVTIVNSKPGNYLKSLVGNVGFFDINNPNIYKAIIPTVLGVGALNQKQKGGAIITNRGQWDYPGQTTIIPSNQITMQGVNYPVLGVSDRGHTQMMYPGLNYSFKGNSVTEYPMMQNGGEVNFTYAGENHRVYKKESLTGNGKGIKGHIMVNHPTEDKGKWDTIDLTKITNGKVKTVAQGVASTKKWHKENPEYADGGQVPSWEIIEDLPKAQNGTTTYPLSVPTRTDSLNLYNNTMQIENYFDKHPEYQVVDRKKEDERELKFAKQDLNNMNAWYKDMLRRNSPPDLIKFAKDGVDRAKATYDFLMRPPDVTKANKVAVDRFNAPGQKVYLIKNGVIIGDSTLPYNEYRNDINDNQYYQREQQNGTLNLDIPMQLFDKRINPDFKKQYMNELTNDGVLLYGYNPIFIKPYDLLTPEERIIVDQKNSTNTTAAPTAAPTTRQIQEEIILPVRKNKIDNPQISKISQPIINIPTVSAPTKDYVTITTGSSYRNPETGAFEQKTFKIDKITGERISEPVFKTNNIKIVPGGYKNGGKTKKSNWQIIKY